MWWTSEKYKHLIVFLDHEGEYIPVGQLTPQGASQAHFKFARSWLTNPDNRAIDPVFLAPRKKTILSAPYAMHLPFYDASPDGWGRQILNAAFPDHHFTETDYLAAAGDRRTGAIAIGRDPDEGPLRWRPDDSPMLGLEETSSLEQLLEAAEAVDRQDFNLNHLHQ